MYHVIKGILLFLLIHITQLFYAQGGVIENSIEWLLESQPEIELSNEIDIAQLQNDLEYLLKNPININSTEVQDLIHYGFLTQIQYNALQEHIKNYGALKAIEELQLVDSFESDQIFILSHYLSTKSFMEAIQLRDELKESKNDLTLHYNQLIQKRAGFIKNTNSYQGHPARVMLKFKSQFYSKWKIGLNFEKDSGEEFAWNWQNNRRVFDYSSFYIEYKSKAIVKKVILGDYQIRLGQGLTFWKGFAFQKSSNTVGIRKVAHELKAHTGMDEINFMRGLSFNLSIKNFQIIPFLSYKKIDAIVSEGENSNIKSIQFSGLHRSPNELLHKASVKEVLYGSYSSYDFPNLKLGASFIFQLYDKVFAIEQSLKKPYPISGNKNFLIGIDCDYRFKNGHVFAEVSRSANSAISYLMGLVVSPDKRLSFSIYHRNFARDFQPISSNAFGESSFTKNEEGFYFGIEYSPKHKISFTAYYDIYRIPWISTKTNGRDAALSALIPLSRRSKLRIKYRAIKSYSTSQGFSIRHKFQIQNEYVLSSAFQLRYRISLHHFKNAQRFRGYLFYLDFIYHKPESPISISTRYAVFNTDDYNTRIYAYERDAYFTYSIRPYYYKGQKVYVNFKWRMRRFFTLFLRFSHITFPFLDELGSGNDLIYGNQKSEFTVQLRIKW